MKKCVVLIALLFFISMAIPASMTYAAPLEGMQQPVAMTDPELDEIVAGTNGWGGLFDALALSGLNLTDLFTVINIGDINISGNTAGTVTGMVTDQAQQYARGLFQNIVAVNSAVYANISVNIFMVNSSFLD